MAAAAPTELARAIRDVRTRVGSHDKLVAKLKADYKMSKASRTLVINWEKNAVPTGGYREALIDLGVKAELFEPLDPAEYPPTPVALMQEVLENQAAILARLGSLEATVDEATQQVAEALAGLASAVEAIEVRSESKPVAKPQGRRAAK